MKNLILTLLMAFTISANADVINQTTSDRLNTEFADLGVTHLELATGLEWLDFGTLIAGERTNVTYGHSVDSAIAAYSPQGFRMATESEVRNLWDLFFPSFVNEGNGTMAIDDTDSMYATLSEERNSWFFAFGSWIDATEGDLYSLGFYLDDAAGAVQEAGVDLLTNPLLSNLYGPDFRKWTTGTDEAFDDRGVFMVRDYSVVPIPAAIWLFGTGLIALLGIARRRA